MIGSDEEKSLQDSVPSDPVTKKKNSPEKIIALVLASVAGILLLLALAAGGFVLYTGSLRPSMFQERSSEEMEKVRVQVVQASTPTPSPPPLGEIVDADWIDEEGKPWKELIAQAEWIIDLGPGGGSAGGEIVFEGTPEQIVCCNDSKTGIYLKEMI